MEKQNNIEVIVSYSIIFIALIAASISTMYLKFILLPLILSIFFYMLITPSLRYIESKFRLPRFLSILLIWIIAGFVLLSVAGVFGVSIRNIGQHVERYQNLVISFATGIASDLGAIGLDVPDAKKHVSDLLKELPIFAFVKDSLSKIVSLFNLCLLVALISSFLIAGSTLNGPQSKVWAEIEHKIRLYLVTKFSVSVATGIITWLILYFFGVEGSILFGVFAFFLNFIPSIGSIIASVMPVPVILMQDMGAITSLFAILLPAFFQFLIGNVAEPKIMGDSLDIHPVTLLLFLLFWWMLWGVAGMLLATPFAVLVKIILMTVPEGRKVAELMAGRYRF